MSKSFQNRLAPGVKFEEWLDATLRSCQGVVKVAPYGTEHVCPEFVLLLRRNQSPAAKLIRYAPDRAMLLESGRVLFYDAKASLAVERDAYEIYNKYRLMGGEVWLFVLHNGRVYYQEIESVSFQDSIEVVNRFTPDKQYPVDEDGWIAPRQKAGFQANGQMSGTTYKYLNLSSFQCAGSVDGSRLMFDFSRGDIIASGEVKSAGRVAPPPTKRPVSPVSRRLREEYTDWKLEQKFQEDMEAEWKTR